jgi:hypothetical protein
MFNLLTHAQSLVYTLLSLMPSRYQHNSLRALLGLFLEATGKSLPEYSKSVSASAISRFLNQYNWSTRAVIKAVRKSVLEQINAHTGVGRRPTLQVILDMTTLEKTGKFKELGNLIRVYNGKRGLHPVVLYISLGRWRLPWNFRVYRGKGHPGCVKLGLKMLRALPKTLTEHYQVQVLVDTAFGSIDFFKQVRKMKYQAIAGVRIDRRLSQGGTVSDISHRGQQVYLEGLTFPVTLSWYWLDRDDGKREKRFVVSTKPLSWSYISRLGKRRWMIEGFFKTAKHRFCLDCFRQRTVLGVYRFIILSIIVYLLAHWAYLGSGAKPLPDWGESAAIAFEVLLPQLLLLNLIIEIKQAKQLARKHGLDLSIRGWQYG